MKKIILLTLVLVCGIINTAIGKEALCNSYNDCIEKTKRGGAFEYISACANLATAYTMHDIQIQIKKHDCMRIIKRLGYEEEIIVPCED